MPEKPISHRPRRLIPVVLALAACLFGRPAVSSADDQNGAPPAATGGLKVNVDPQTGGFLETPPPAAEATTPPPAASAPVIEVRPSTVPGGGFGFEVPESAHPEIKATTAPDGKAHVACGEADK